jgi:hypothetical protein
VTAQELIARVEAAGGRLEAHGSALDVLAPRPLAADLVAALRAHKADVLRLLGGCPRCRRSRAAGIHVLMCSCGFESPATRARLARAPSAEMEARLLAFNRECEKAEGWVEL